MKVALIIEHFDQTRGGAEHLAVWLANQLQKRGHEVHVVCHDVSARINRYRQATLRASHDATQSHKAHALPETRHDGLHIHRLRGMRINTAIGFRLFGVRARQWIRRHQPDVAHSFTVACAGDVYHAYAGVYAAMQAQAAASRPTESRASWKRVLQRLPGKQRTLLALERQLAAGDSDTPRHMKNSGTKKIIALCDMTARQFADAYPEAQTKTTVLELPRLETNGTDHTPEHERDLRKWFRSHYRLAPHERVALFIGHDFRRKGLRYAIEAIARTKDWKLLVVGLGKTREYVELAAALGIGEPTGDGTRAEKSRILFIGPTSQMQAVYAAGDALLLPTFYEPSSLVVLEALSHGLPIVSTEFLGSADLVKRSNVGTIVSSPRDVNDLARALENLPARGTPEQQPLDARARAAGKGPSPEAFIHKLLALYQQVRSG